MASHGRVMQVVIPLGRVRFPYINRVWIPNFLFEAYLDTTQTIFPLGYQFRNGETKETDRLTLLFPDDMKAVEAVFFDHQHQRCYVQMVHPRFFEWLEGHDCPCTRSVFCFYENGTVFTFNPESGRVSIGGRACRLTELNSEADGAKARN